MIFARIFVQDFFIQENDLSSISKGKIAMTETRETGRPIVAWANLRLDKRETIVEAASALFLQAGYEATTIADVAARAQMAVGSIYRYVADKRELLEAVRQRFAGQMAAAMRRALEGEGPEAARLSAMVDALAASAMENPAALRFLFLAPQHMEPASACPMAEPMTAALESLLAPDVEAGRMEPVRARAAAELGHGMILACLRRCLGPAPRDDLHPVIVDLLKSGLSDWLGTVRARARC